MLEGGSSGKEARIPYSKTPDTAQSICDCCDRYERLMMNDGANVGVGEEGLEATIGPAWQRLAKWRTPENCPLWPIIEGCRR